MKSYNYIYNFFQSKKSIAFIRKFLNLMRSVKKSGLQEKIPYCFITCYIKKKPGLVLLYLILGVSFESPLQFLWYASVWYKF